MKFLGTVDNGPRTGDFMFRIQEGLWSLIFTKIKGQRTLIIKQNTMLYNLALLLPIYCILIQYYLDP